MLTYTFEKTGNTSLYEYLYKCIRRDILDGTIAAGEKLPSKRSLAKNLGVSVITVENAYAQLVAEGYIYSVPKSGYYAAEINKYLLMPESAQAGSRQMGGSGQRELPGTRQTGEPGRKILPGDRGTGQDGLSSSLIREEKTEICQESPAVQKKWLADFVNSRMDSAQFPFTIWARLLRGVLAGQRGELMEKAPGAGVYKLRQAIAGYLRQFQGMQVRAEQIIIGAGTEYLYSLLIQLLGQDRVYGLEDPGYVKIAQVYRSYQVKTAYISMDEKGVQMDALREKNADIIHISPSHHYPTGITMPIGRRYELLAWAGEKDERYIIEDDYDCEFRLAGKSIPPLQSIGEGDKVIYMNTFTKSLTPTIRISYMVLPEALRQRFEDRLGFYSCTVSNFEQYTLAEFISEGYFEKHINRMRNFYRNKRDRLLEIMENSRLFPHIKVYEADAGLHFLMKVNTEMTDEALTERAAEAGIRISCLSEYYYGKYAAGSRQEGKVVVNYSGLEDEQMEPVVQKLYEAWFEPKSPKNP